MKKEFNHQLFKEKLDPLMQEVVTICREHGIALLANFKMPPEADGHSEATIIVPGKLGNPTDHLLALMMIDVDEAEKILSEAIRSDQTSH